MFKETWVFDKILKSEQTLKLQKLMMHITNYGQVCMDTIHENFYFKKIILMKRNLASISLCFSSTYN